MQRESTDPTASVVSSPPVFSLRGRVFTVDDILDSARCSGDWEPFRAAWEQRQQAAQAAEAQGLSPEKEAVEEALNDFRYARDLVSGEECERWLTARGLTFPDLVGCVTRRLQAELGAEEQSGDAEIAVGEALLRNDAILADEFTGWAHQFARRLAAAVEAGADLPAAAPVEEWWPAIEEAYRGAVAAVIRPDVRQRELASLRLGLMRLQFDLAEFDSESAAREAALCVRQDQEPLAEVAASNGFPCESLQRFFGDLEKEWADVLVGARSGDVIVHRPEGGNWLVVEVKARSEPSLEDPAVSLRVDRVLTERYFCERESRHVRWLINVEAEA